MPELPEVETVRRGLRKLVIGKKISKVDFDWPKGFPNSESDVEEFLVGATITNVRRRAKVLIIDLDSGYSLVIHLKMTGQLVFVQDQLSGLGTRDLGQEVEKSKKQKEKSQDSDPSTIYQPPSTSEQARFGAGHPNDSLINRLPDKSTRVVFHFENSEKRKKKKEKSFENLDLRFTSYDLPNPTDFQPEAHLYFNDQRKFGWVRLLPTIEVPNIDFMKRLGPEPLASTFTGADFVVRMRRRNKSGIKAVLLDQSVIAGVGNIYADESLWAAKIHPESKVADVSDSRLKVLFNELKAILELSIEKGGSTDRNYVDAEGKKGSYMSFAKVFRREGKPCQRCSTEITKIRVAGRGTHLCKKCQKVDK